jgi:hypothetical protein
MAKKKKKKILNKREVHLQPFVIAGLRRLSYKYRPRNEAMKRARLRRGVYRCAICGQEVRKKDMQMDHIEPVLDVKTGFIDYNTYIARLFVSIDGWQVVCKKPCHSEKTKAENAKRREFQKKRRLDKSSKS